MSEIIQGLEGADRRLKFASEAWESRLKNNNDDQKWIIYDMYV